MPEALPPIERRANILAATPPLRLGVNIDHVATVRNARGGTHPDPVRAAMIAIEAGADGITAHLREDRRHIRDADIARLKAEIVKPLNLEMAATPELVAIAVKTRPHAACIVPERRGEVTTEGGLDAVGQYNLLAPAVAKLNEAAIRVSLFIAAGSKADRSGSAAAGSRLSKFIPAPGARRGPQNAPPQRKRNGGVLCEGARLATPSRPRSSCRPRPGLWDGGDDCRIGGDCRTQYRPFPDRRSCIRRAPRFRADDANGHGARPDAGRFSEGHIMILGIGSDLVDVRRIARVDRAPR